MDLRRTILTRATILRAAAVSSVTPPPVPAELRRLRPRIRRGPAAFFRVGGGDGPEGAEFSGDDAARGAGGIVGATDCRWRVGGAAQIGLVRNQDPPAGCDSAAGDAGSGSIRKMSARTRCWPAWSSRGELSPDVAGRWRLPGWSMIRAGWGRISCFSHFAGSRVDGRRFARDAIARGALRGGERSCRGPSDFAGRGSKWSTGGARWPRPLAISIGRSGRAGSVHGHHRHQRKNHDVLSDRCDFAGGGIRDRVDRHDRVSAGGRSAGGGEHDA